MTLRKYRNNFVLRDYPAKLYRFLPEEWQADAMADKGEIHISTLRKCRAYENARRGDKEEAISKYFSGSASGDINDLRVREIARRTGIGFAPGSKRMISMNHYVRTKTINDLYLLCVTGKFEPENMTHDFGKYCVEISDIESFYTNLCDVLSNKFKVTSGMANKVIYQDRTSTGLEDMIPDHFIPFIKPNIREYVNQHEFRFVWSLWPSRTTLEPITLRCSNIMHNCKRVL